MFGLKKEEVQVINQAAVAILEKPQAVAAPSFIKAARAEQGDLGEYADVAQEIGLMTPHLIVERFLAVMEELDLPIYNLREVIAYMDDKAKRDGTGYGWEWRPVRDKDHAPGFMFGTASQAPGPMQALGGATTVTPASDYYYFPSQVPADPSNPQAALMQQLWWGGPRSPSRYDKQVPLRAIKRIAAIEKNYDGPKSFMVSDYATQPHLKPDPFLLVLLRNVPADMGRFVVDFWDEPGFGIEQMLK